MSDRFIANSVRYGIKDTVKDKFLELEEVAELLNNAEDNGLLAGKIVLLVEDGSADVEKLEKDSLCVTIYSSNWKRFLGGFFVNKTKLADGTEYWICSARPKR